jgi:hypothetical protein
MHCITKHNEDNYLRIAEDSFTAPPSPSEIVRSLTEPNNLAYRLEVNSALEVDAYSLEAHGDFIKAPHGSIRACPFLDQGCVFQDVDLSEHERLEMEQLGVLDKAMLSH